MIYEAIHKQHRPATWWATESEKQHIAQMGVFTKASKDGRPHDQKARRLMLLQAYGKAARLRKNWGDIDPKEILAFVTRKLEEAQNGGSKTKKGMEGENG